jgi:toxin ParE1/3/4
MAEIDWTELALDDLNGIAEYIALDKPAAAAALVQRVLAHVEKLKSHPELGPAIPELLPSVRYRQLVEPPCRIFYRYDASEDRCHILHVIRGEKLFQKRLLFGREE